MTPVTTQAAQKILSFIKDTYSFVDVLKLCTYILKGLASIEYKHKCFQF